MTFPTPRIDAWRALVEKELAGKSFDGTLVHRLAEGLRVAPLYTEATTEATAARAVAPSSGFLVCPRSDDASELADGADALWTSSPALLGVTNALLVFDQLPIEALTEDRRVLLGHDPIPAGKPVDFGAAAKQVSERFPNAITVTVSTLPYHDAGADVADELALALSTGAAYLGALFEAGLGPAAAAKQIGLRIAVGRDTFLELAKLRALRVCWQKLLAAVNADARPVVHAVASNRTLAAPDPWVNMIRVTTQIFAAAVGGADLVTAQPFDGALGTPSALGRRVARNTGLVLREESFLGRIGDAAGGSYYVETLTDALAREAWKRFRAIEGDGGIAAMRADGRLAARLEATWQERLGRIATRRLPIVGVSEFASRSGDLAAPRHAPAGTDARRGAPHPAAAREGPGGADSAGSRGVEGRRLPVHRDAEGFEALRGRAEKTRPEAVLVTLGAFADSRARVGFATGFLAAGGIGATESASLAETTATIAVVCGSDAQYALDAVATVRALKAAGAERVLLAGRPGPLEEELKAAGLDGAIHVGCDVVATLSALLGDDA